MFSKACRFSCCTARKAPGVGFGNRTEIGAAVGKKVVNTTRCEHFEIRLGC